MLLGNTSAPQAVTLEIVNELDSKPTWQSSNDAGAINENSGAGLVVYTAIAEVNLETDPNNPDAVVDAEGISISYSLSDDSNGAFAIDSDTGAVSLVNNPDYENVSSYEFSVVATDSLGNVSQALDVSLAVNNLDEAAPSITSGAVASAIDENSGAGQVVYTASADDSNDTSDGVSFSIAGVDADKFDIDASSGAVTLNR